MFGFCAAKSWNSFCLRSAACDGIWGSGKISEKTKVGSVVCELPPPAFEDSRRPLPGGEAVLR